MAHSKKKINGEYCTPDLLAKFVAEIIVNEITILRESEISVLDPAVGDGKLLLAISKKLREENYIIIHFTGYDISKEALAIAKNNLDYEHNHNEYKLEERNFLELFSEENLFSDELNSILYDLIISNPPYIRTQILGAKLAKEIAKVFNLTGRVDIYHAFIEGIYRSLKPNGLTGIIIPNKFMTNKSGSRIRKRILDKFDILHIWDFGDTQLFDAAVLPCVLLLRKKSLETQLGIITKFTSIYTTSKNESTKKSDNVFDVISESGIYNIYNKDFVIKQGTLDLSSASGIWRLKNDESERWLNIVKENTFLEFGDIGKIRVGVKTTADNVFISSEWESLENTPELLRPLITHHTARRYKAKENNIIKILYPYTHNSGKRILIDIEEHPNTKDYLLQNEKQLKSRTYIRESKKKWYEIWVPHHPELWEKPKIVFRDIAEEPTFWIDLGKSVVNGDCYWFVNDNNENEDLLWLALAIGNSKFIEKYYDLKFNNKLYSGRRRFMTQYVKEFPLPNPNNEISKEIIELSKRIYMLLSLENTDNIEENMNTLVMRAFGL